MTYLIQTSQKLYIFAKKINMKKIIISAVLLTHSIMMYAQFISAYTAAFDSIYSNISRKEATTGILYERVVPFAELYKYNSTLLNRVDTSNMSHFMQAYFELYNATFLSSRMFPFDIDSLRSLMQKNNLNSTIPIVNVGLLHCNFNMIDSAVASRKLYFDTDSVLQENTEILESLYTERTAFVASPLQKLVLTGTVHFLFSNLFRFDNNGNKIVELRVDFDDGIGLQIIRDTINTVTYTINGIKTLRFEALLKSGDTMVAYAEIECVSPSISRSSGWKYIEKLNGNKAIKAKITLPNPYTGGNFTTTQADVWIFYKDSERKLSKPVLIADGFDPQNKRVILII